MSNRMTPRACGSTSGVQPVAASRASVSRSTISSSMPTSVAHALEEVEAVARRAAGFGRDQPRARDAAVAHLGAADPQRLDRAHDRGLAQPAGTGDALAQPDDARERVDHAEAVARGARHQQPAIVGAEIERGIGRAGQVLPTRAAPAVAARMPIGRPPAPPGPTGLPVRHRAEAGRPGLVVHLKPFPTPKPDCAQSAGLDGAAVNPTSRESVESRPVGATLSATLGAREDMAETGGCACETGLVRYLKPARVALRKQAKQAKLLHEHPGYRQDPLRLRHRPAGAAQGGRNAAARRRPLHRRHQSAGSGPRLHPALERRARADQVDRHRRRQEDEGRARRLHRRGRGAIRHAAIGAAVQEQGRHRPEEAAAAGAADRQGALRRRSDRLRGGRDRAGRPRTQPRRSRSTSSRCRW